MLSNNYTGWAYSKSLYIDLAIIGFNMLISDFQIYNIKQTLFKNVSKKIKMRTIIVLQQIDLHS